MPSSRLGRSCPRPLTCALLLVGLGQVACGSTAPPTQPAKVAEPEAPGPKSDPSKQDNAQHSPERAAAQKCCEAEHGSWDAKHGGCWDIPGPTEGYGDGPSDYPVCAEGTGYEGSWTTISF